MIYSLIWISYRNSDKSKQFRLCSPTHISPVMTAADLPTFTPDQCNISYSTIEAFFNVENFPIPIVDYFISYNTYTIEQLHNMWLYEPTLYI